MKFATLNIQGIKRLGKREKVKYWMKKNNVNILLLQETHVNMNVREQRKHFTWFFAGSVDKKDSTGKRVLNTEAGVAIILNNELLNFIWDIQPISDRLITLTLGYSIPISFISAYMPYAYKDSEDKEFQYNEFNEHQIQLQKKGPTYTGGDFNARIQRKQGTSEQCVGQHSFDPHNNTLAQQDENIVENRNLFIAHCLQTDNVIANTLFQKPEHKKATSRHCETKHGPPYSMANGYAAIDFIAALNRLNNSVLDAESDTSFMDSDHYPVTASIRIELKAKPFKARKGRQKYEPPTPEQTFHYNDQLDEINKWVDAKELANVHFPEKEKKGTEERKDLEEKKEKSCN